MAAAPEVLNVSLAAREYVRKGWALVPIASGTKGPTGTGWNRRENCVTEVEQCTRIKANVGLAHAFSGTCVIDLDKMDKALDWFAEQGVDLEALWSSPDAVRISSGRPNRGKLLYKLPVDHKPLITRQLPEHGFELRCASGSGNTMQDVLPPSIHPDTGLPYVWEYDELLGHWSEPPELPRSVLELWTSLRRVEDKPVEEKAPVGLGQKEIRKLLSRLDPDLEYNDWLTVGFAVHHEMRGADMGLDLWDEWSSQGEEYPGREKLEYKWSTFGKERNSPEITVRSLMNTADIATVEDFDDIDEPPPAGAVEENPRFTVKTAAEFANKPPLSWIIKKILPRAALGVIFGQSGAGKSFMVLDMIAAVARGIDWRGFKTQKGRVVMVVAEGAAGAVGRLAAYAQHNGIDLADLEVGIIEDVPDLTKMDHKRIAKRIEAYGGADIIVFDTLAQSVAGANENSAEDMGKAIKHCKDLHTDTGALVLLVHHAGKDSERGARGWSGIKAAADIEIEVSRTLQQRVLKVTKSKDSADGAEMAFKLNTVILGQDSDGDDITSCVIEHSDEPVNREQSGLKGHAATAFATISALLDLESEITYATAMDACAAQLPHEEGKRDRRRDLMLTAFNTLVSKGLLINENGTVRLK